jgi:hypothetical protein
MYASTSHNEVAEKAIYSTNKKRRSTAKKKHGIITHYGTVYTDLTYIDSYGIITSYNFLEEK